MPKLAKIVCAAPDCKVKFVPKTKRSRFHSDACRQRTARAEGVDPITGEILQPILPAGASDANVVGGAGRAAEGRTKAAEKESKAYDREKNLKRFIKMGVAEVNWLSTGIPDFDALTRIPRGRITQIEGRYGVGKTTLCLNMIAGMQGVRTLYIDSEAALNPHLLVDLEIDPDNFTLYNESSYIEDISEVIREGAKSGKYDLIVLDSVPMTTTKTIADSEITASNIGQKAKIIHKLVELIAMDLKATDTAMVFINQVRDVIGSYVPQTYTPGGTGIPFQASLIVGLKTIKSWRFPEKPKDKIYLGQYVEATIVKSKVNQPHRVAKFKLFYPNPHAEVAELEESPTEKEF